MRVPTLLFFFLIKIYNPISIYIREKRKKKKISFSLFLALTLRMFLPHFFCLFILFFFLIWIHGSHCAMCLSLIRVRFYSEIIYFFSVQFILNELSSCHFLTSEIFVKISSLKSLATYHLENRKNISTISEFDETFLGY